MNSRVVSEANSKSMTDPNPTTPKRERPEDACSLSAVPMTAWEMLETAFELAVAAIAGFFKLIWGTIALIGAMILGVLGLN
ncbi:MAG: hypothetical protein AB1490_16645 [Pseudomonadota bacterium]